MAYKTFEGAANAPHDLFSNTREIHLSCEPEFSRVYGWKKVAGLIAAIWSEAITKHGSMNGDMVHLNIDDFSLRRSLCPFRYVEFKAEKLSTVFSVTYAPRPKYFTAQLTKVILPNDVFYRVDKPTDEKRESAEVTFL